MTLHTSSSSNSSGSSNSSVPEQHPDSSLNLYQVATTAIVTMALTSDSSNHLVDVTGASPILSTASYPSTSSSSAVVGSDDDDQKLNTDNENPTQVHSTSGQIIPFKFPRLTLCYDH